MSDDIAIEIKNVSKDFILPHEKITTVKSAFTGMYKRHDKSKEVLHALRDVSFEIRKGEFFGIVGRNGSGKSTLLKMLAGIYQPTHGSIMTHGKLVPFIELGVGFNPELTGRENVYLNGAMMGFSQKETDGMYDDIVAFAELEEFMDQKLKNYSSGMQVRLAFSVAIKAEADVLIIDEVLAVGDAAFKRKCYNYFKSIKRKQVTVVFVSHDMEAVREFCNRAVLIDAGKMQHSGRPDEMAKRYWQLFNVPDKSSEMTDESSRWGNGWVQGHKVEHNLKDDFLTIRMQAHATRAVDNVVLGIRIRNGAGQEVTGTNSAILKMEPYSFDKGQTKSVTWRLPNIFSNGEFFIDPAIVIGDGATVLDWWDGAGRFEVRKDMTTSYIVTPPVSLEVKGAS